MMNKNKLQLLKESKNEGTSIQIDLTNDEFNILSKIEKIDCINTKFVQSENYLKAYDDSHSLFLAELYILSDDLKFDDFLNKFETKLDNIDNDYFIYDYTNNIFKLVPLINKEHFETYKFNIKNKNIELGTIARKNLYITPVFFDNWLNFIEKTNIDKEYKKQITERLTYFRELLSLIYISNKFVFKDNNFTFYIEDSTGEQIVYEQEWLKSDEIAKNDYFDILKWIDNNNNNKLNSEILLKIVRKYFIQSGSFSIGNKTIEKLESLLNIILKNDVEIYYNQKNKLKSELFEIEKLMIENKRTILKNLVGLITSIGIGYYGIIFKDSENFNFLKEDKGLMILFIFMLIATLFFTVTFYLNIKEIQDFYTKTQDVYLDHFLFNKDDFESVLKKPRLKKLISYWVILLSFILIQLILINNYAKGEHGFLAWVSKTIINFLLYL